MGICSVQVDDRRRGFSLQNLEKYPETRLDMRMNSDVGLSASEWLQDAKVEEIAWVLKEFGPDDQDSYRAERLAQAIKDDQELNGSYESMSRFAELVGRELMVGTEQFEHTATGRAHPARLTLQAIRLFLNCEIEQLREGLHSAFQVLAMGGRCVVTTFKRKEAAVVTEFLAEMEDPDPKKAPKRGAQSAFGVPGGADSHETSPGGALPLGRDGAGVRREAGGYAHEVAL